MYTVEYLKLEITGVDNHVWNQPLKLSEAHLIAQIVKENKSVLATLGICSSPEEYKLIFWE